MLKKEKKLNNSFYLPWFIVLAIFPQIFKFNGTAFDTAWKIVLVLGMLFILYLKNGHNFFRFNSFSLIYLSILIICSMIGCVINSSIFFEECEVLVFRILIFFIFYISTLWQDFDDDNITIFLKIFANFILIACLYNIVFNFNSFLNMSSITVYDTATGVSSFFDNKNAFGVFLTFGLISALFLRIIKNKKIWDLYIAFFLLNEVVTLCRSAIFISVLMIVSVIFLQGKHKFRIFFSLLIIVVCLIVVYKLVPTINMFVDRNFKEIISADRRLDQWSSLLPFLKGDNLFFGFGNAKAYELSKVYAGKAYYHSTYLYLLLSSGICGLCCFLIAIVNTSITSFKILKINHKYGVFCIASIVSYLVYSMAENYMVFDTPVISMTITAFCFSLPIIIYKTLVKEKFQQNI